MLRVNWPVVDRIHPQSNKFAMGVENKATGDSKLNDSPDQDLSSNLSYHGLTFQRDMDHS